MENIQGNVSTTFLLSGVYSGNGKSNLRNIIPKSIAQTGQSNKKELAKDTYPGLFASVINRRAFLKTSSRISLLATLTACKPSFPDSQSRTKVSAKAISPADISEDDNYFTDAQHKVIDAVQMQLFPDDGNGPSARDLNAVTYLEWAMTDPINIEDGDPEFIAKGIAWLNDLSEQTNGKDFINLSGEQQDKTLKQISKSQAGENWLSLLIYYLTEALMLDPVYGGNPEMIGWKLLEHQPGFPGPVEGKTYRDFG